MSKQRLESKFFSLDKKVLVVGFAISILFCIASSLISRFLQEKIEAESLQKELSYFQSIVLPSVTDSTWKMDFEQSKVQLEGLLTNPNIARIVIQDIDLGQDTFLEVAKKERLNNLVKYEYPLLAPNQEAMVFAKLTLYVTLDPMAARINSETMRQFMFNFIQILILSFLLLHVFRKLVLERIVGISEYFRKNIFLSKETPVLAEKTHEVYCDEIDALIDSINRTVEESKKHQLQIEELKDHADRANRAKSHFLTSINHELRTPLTTILGVCDVLPDMAENPTKLKSMLELQRRSGLHLRHLVDEILDLSKIEAGQLRINISSMSLRECLRTCEMLLEKSIGERKNQLSIEFGESFPDLISGDSVRVNQIIINLISNANKFTSQGSISVAVKAYENFYEILVADTGKGIARDRLDEIFLPFRQLANSPGELKRGTGIGLSIAKQLTELMGGKISVHSVVGEGTVFTLRLPLEPIVSEDEHQSSFLENSPVWFGSEVKLLIAEDTEEIRTLIEGYLQPTGIEFDFAKDGEECLRKFKEGFYDLIFMDLQMPSMNGLDAIQIIRDFEIRNQFGRIPILAMTALTTKSELDSALNLGFCGYITKPFSRQKFLKMVQDFARPSEKDLKLGSKLREVRVEQI